MDRAQKNYIKMTETPVARLIISLGIPTTVSMLITNIYNLADTYFVGGLGESQQGATGILFTLQAIIQAIAFMLGHGSGAFVSKHLAASKQEKADEYVSTAFFSGAAFGLLLSIIGLSFLTPLMRLLGSTETILPYAKDYGMWVLISCPFMICSLILNNNLRYEGKAFYAMIGLTTGGILNIFGDYVLIELLDMGVYGAGLSTAASQFVSFVILIVLYIKNAQSTIRPRSISRSASVYFDIFKVGLPSLIRQGLSSVSNGLLNNIVKPYGDAAIAAMTVVNRYSSFVMCVGLGIGQGFQPLASFNYEVKKYDRVKKGLLFTVLVGEIFVFIMAGIGAAFSSSIIRIFQKSEAVIEVGVPALRFASAGLLFMPLSVPVNMLYQSIRRAGTASLLALMRSGLIFIPVLVILSITLKITGIEMAQPVADAITGIASVPFGLYFLKNPSFEKKQK
ncbi:MAG: MATE family efflux transporter [Clostridiales bacterium]|nr:MATE family efflux transporter [Clostridiales bacterium]